MPRPLAIASIPCLVLALFPACHGGGGLTTSSTQGSGGSTGCEAPCCEDDPQFPIQRGDACVQCDTDADCKDLGFESAYGLKCQSNGACGCAVDDDCVGDPAYPRCRAADASCVQCLSNADCDTTCDVADGTCVPCASDADCHASALGPHCGASGCGCASDAECAASAAGPSCPALDGSADGAICGCTADADCAQSSQGHTCTLVTEQKPEQKQCGCSTNADCAAGSSCQTIAHRCFPG